MELVEISPTPSDQFDELHETLKRQGSLSFHVRGTSPFDRRSHTLRANSVE
ncbi:hypothetical protein [Caballeronia sp. NK8]|uniref:hypothetical protein n=1 Tax=Caballeronia sp. NK8 TaxID=140098 RepID=UPI001CEC7B8B|nr:hypothetical protein [Caballeronia sp. NK8]